MAVLSQTSGRVPLVGIVLGLAAALFFGSASVLLRIGMRTAPQDDGLFMTIVVNVVLLGAIGVFVPKPVWDLGSVAVLAAAGLIGAAAGGFAFARAVRLIGASRTSVFMNGSPIITAAAGWIILDESVGLADALGAILVMASLTHLVRTRSTAEQVPGTLTAQLPIWAWYLVASAAPILLGLALVLRKWGLESFDSVVFGALIGSVAALFALTIIDYGTGRLRQRISDNFVEANWWYIGAGVAISLALLSQFWAFAFAPVWVIGVLQGTQALWVLILGHAFLRREERVDATVIIAALVVVAGVVLISFNA